MKYVVLSVCFGCLSSDGRNFLGMAAYLFQSWALIAGKQKGEMKPGRQYQSIMRSRTSRHHSVITLYLQHTFGSMTTFKLEEPPARITAPGGWGRRPGFGQPPGRFEVTK
jgi:hypothetical protein